MYYTADSLTTYIYFLYDYKPFSKKSNLNLKLVEWSTRSPFPLHNRFDLCLTALLCLSTLMQLLVLSQLDTFSGITIILPIGVHGADQRVSLASLLFLVAQMLQIAGPLRFLRMLRLRQLFRDIFDTLVSMPSILFRWANSCTRRRTRLLCISQMRFTPLSNSLSWIYTSYCIMFNIYRLNLF